MIQNISRYDRRAMQWSCENQKSISKSTVCALCITPLKPPRCSQLHNSTVIEGMMSQICAVLDFFHQSPICCSVLKEMVKIFVQEVIKKLLISGKARCIARLDAFDKFCDLLPAILTAIETIAKNFDAKYSRNNAEKTKPPFMGTCQFQIIVTVRKKHY